MNTISAIAKALKIPPIMVVGENNRGAVNLGQFTNLRPGSKGGLTADIEVPKAIHGLAKQQLIRNLSMEILHNVMVNGKFYPMVVKAGCLLGRENPAIPLSDFKLSERQGFGEFSTYTLSEFVVSESIQLAGPTTGDVHQPSILKKRIRNKQGNREVQLENRRAIGLAPRRTKYTQTSGHGKNRNQGYIRKDIDRPIGAIKKLLKGKIPSPLQILRAGEKFYNSESKLAKKDTLKAYFTGDMTPGENKEYNRRLKADLYGPWPELPKSYKVRNNVELGLGAIIGAGAVAWGISKLLKKRSQLSVQSELASPSSKVWKDWKARGKPYKMYKGKRIANIINMKSGPSPADKYKEPTNNKFFPMFRNSSYLSKSQKFTNYKVPVTTVTSGQVPNKRVEVIHVKASDPSRAQTSALRLLERGFGKTFEIVGSAVGLILAVHLGKKYLIGKGVKGSDFVRKLESPTQLSLIVGRHKPGHKGPKPTFRQDESSIRRPQAWGSS